VHDWCGSGVAQLVQATPVLASGHDTSNAPVFAIDIDQMEDKPWRRPGVAVSDYFNYGFTEETWRAYCQRQAQLRLENQMRGKIAVYRPAANTVLPPPTVQHLAPYDADASSSHYSSYDGGADSARSGAGSGAGARAHDERSEARDAHSGGRDHRYDADRDAKRPRH
jgi:hypothetical protein